MTDTNRVPEALAILKEALEDDGYFISWQANLAMAFKDQIINNPQESLHENCNNAAIEFMNRLFKANFERKV